VIEDYYYHQEFEEKHSEKVFIVVKTAPNPSTKYRETVCTAGITEKGKWIRMYPIPYRYLTTDKWFSKYQWVALDIKKRPKEKDFRSGTWKVNYSKGFCCSPSYYR